MAETKNVLRCKISYLESRLRYAEKEILFYQIIFIILILFFVIIINNLVITENVDNNIRFNETELYNSLDNINNKCDTLFLVKNPSSKPKGFYVFKNTCKYGNYCKYDYVPIKECLN